MPSTDMIIWTAISGLIIVMLGIIGYLISTGFDNLKQQLQTLWDKLDNHQAMAEKNAQDIARIEARCEERHK
jgi:hypothetical protein